MEFKSYICILKFYNMELNKADKTKCGIYCIQNTVNKKVYVGKALVIYSRIQSHIYTLRKKSKDENRHLIAAWHKYGEDKFIYYVLEELPIDENLLREKEDYWIVKLDATNPEKGYNIRRDSSTGMIVSKETRELISRAVTGENNPNYGNYWSQEQRENLSKKLKEQYANGERKISPKAWQNGIASRNKNWEENPQLKENMKRRISKKETQYQFYQYDKKTKELIKIWNSVFEILQENPEWKRHNIYAACSGEKPSIYGYIWEKKLKNDIVQQ